jgi:tetratricopeptide (TPR) repeat protein
MHIRLAMICRDEAHRLPDVAEMLGDRIQSVCILVDERTTDDTDEVAEALWGHLDGCVLPFRFEDFAQARNELLEAAREGCDYLLLLDPDSPLVGTWPDELTDEAYACIWRMSAIEWPRTILLRSDAKASYEGAAHEVIFVDTPQVRVLDTCHVDAVVTAGPERLAWIEGILRRDAATSPRSAFYLAQTLQDQGRLDEAFGWYMRRAAMGEGWVEETYMSVYRAAEIIQRLDWETAEMLWTRSLKLRQRAEPCYQLAAQLNHLGRHSEALKWASTGLQMGASADELFVNRWIEREGLSMEFDRAADALFGFRPDAPRPTLQTVSGEEPNG